MRGRLWSADPLQFWQQRVPPALDTYMGSIFERIAEEGYARLRETHGLPMVTDWDRWEGKDRHGEQIDIDIACRLTDGRIMTGAVKWNRRRVGLDVHERHLAMLERLAPSGIKWAHGARERSAPQYT